MDLQHETITAAARRQPVYWFTVLELAMAAGDLEEAARAVRELRRLGIDVTYRCRSPRKVVADVH